MVMKYFFFGFIFITLSFAGQCTGSAEIIFLRGKVEIFPSSMQYTQTAKLGEKISQKHGIKTYTDGLLILKLEDESIVKIDPNSVIIIENLILKDLSKLKGNSTFHINSGGIMAYTRKSNYPRNDNFRPRLEIKYADMVIELNKGKVFIGVDQLNNNLWMSTKEGSSRIINYILDDYIDIKFGQSVFIEQGQHLSIPDKYAWPLRLNWQMNLEKNARLQSNFYALEITRQEEYKLKQKKLSQREKNSFSKISSKRITDLKKKKNEVLELFTKFNLEVKPEKISIFKDDVSKKENKKLKSTTQKGILNF